MYNVGVENFKEKNKEWESFIKLFLFDWNIEKKEIDCNNDKYDLIILIEKSMEKFSDTFLRVSELKKASDSLICVWIERDKSFNDLAYIMIGSDMVIYSDGDFEDRLFILKNALDRRDKFLNEKIIENFSHSRSEKFELDPMKRTIKINGVEISLTKLEYRILSFLMDNFGTAVTFEEIYNAVWDMEYSEKKVYRISNLIFHIRTKFEQSKIKTLSIKTVRSIGYLISY